MVTFINEKKLFEIRNGRKQQVTNNVIHIGNDLENSPL